MKKYIKGNRVITATDKAYRLLYEPVGYKPYTDKDITVAEIKGKLDDLGVEYTTRETKDELLAKLEGD